MDVGKKKALQDDTRCIDRTRSGHSQIPTEAGEDFYSQNLSVCSTCYILNTIIFILLAKWGHFCKVRTFWRIGFGLGVCVFLVLEDMVKQ